jgi:cytoskeletal protein CcmA (bactofilin family)
MTATSNDTAAHSSMSVIAPGMKFTGHIEGRDIMVLGSFEGQLHLSGQLRLKQTARVKATVIAASVEINGEFEGEIQTQLIVFGQTARARGTFGFDRIAMHEGAQVSGSFDRLEATRLIETPAAREKSPEPSANQTMSDFEKPSAPAAESSTSESANAAAPARSSAEDASDSPVDESAPRLASGAAAAEGPVDTTEASAYQEQGPTAPEEPLAPDRQPTT